MVSRRGISSFPQLLRCKESLQTCMTRSECQHGVIVYFGGHFRDAMWSFYRTHIVHKILTSDHKPVSATFGLTAYALPSSNSGVSNDSDDKRWHVRFTSLRAKNLRASDINGFSDPYLSFIGPNLVQRFHSKVKYQTLNPVWNPLKELPTLVLNIFPLKRLEKEYLMVQVRDHDSRSADYTLGYTAIPLASAVIAFNKGPLETATFRVELLHHGLPAGTLEGGMKLTWERNVIKRRSRIARELIARTLSLRDSLRRTVSK